MEKPVSGALAVASLVPGTAKACRHPVRPEPHAARVCASA